MDNIDSHSRFDTSDWSRPEFAYKSRVLDPKKQRIYEEEVDGLIRTIVHLKSYGHLFDDSFYEIYLRHHFGYKVRPASVLRHLRGAVICNLSEKTLPVQTVDAMQVDYILENSLQKKDFRAIRLILNHEGYGVPVYETDDPNVLAEVYDEQSQDSEKVEIEITPEEHQILMAPLDTTLPSEPTDMELSVQKAFAEAMAESIPLRLDRLIRRRDTQTLRMMLRVYGHRLLPDEPSSQGYRQGSLPEPLQ